ncbi:MAG: thioredoxin family protein [Sphingobacteriaceae bacterium]|nr:thioredoxin family protein [Sphingobacteriaceae bacterium]MBK7817398.1 thioredoxin family protein [Sphingobacteriaceae bacterium]
MLNRIYIRRIVFISFLHFLLSITFAFAQKTGTTAKPTKTVAKETEALEWHTDLFKVYDISKKTKKPIFAFFTGSDWCGWCKKLQADVFAKPEFISWASKNVVLLELDYPRFKQLSPELTQQNQNLQQTFQIAGYPTIWMFNLDKPDTSSKFNIDAIGSLGYPQGAEQGKEQVKFLDDANRLMDAKKNGTK